MHCGDQYPNEPPVIRFVSRINIPCVDPTSGHVVSASSRAGPSRGCRPSSSVPPHITPPPPPSPQLKARLPILSNWQRNFTIEQVLVELRREMNSQANRRLPQPPEGLRF